MKRREVIEKAKDLVLFHGAYTVLEFGTELFWRSHTRADDLYDEDKAGGFTDADADEVVAEATKQAERVLRFLGR